MKRHTVTVDELDEWLNREIWSIGASSHGKGSDKFLKVSQAGIFRVIDHDEIKYTGDDKYAAVQAYNEAP